MIVEFEPEYRVVEAKNKAENNVTFLVIYNDGTTGTIDEPQKDGKYIAIVRSNHISVELSLEFFANNSRLIFEVRKAIEWFAEIVAKVMKDDAIDVVLGEIFACASNGECVRYCNLRDRYEEEAIKNAQFIRIGKDVLVVGTDKAMIATNLTLKTFGGIIK